MGFPGGTVVENLPANAGGHGSMPGWGSRSHMHATAKSPHATTKILCAKMKTQHSQNIK